MLRQSLFFAFLAVAASAQILPGDSRQNVLSILGQPKSTVVADQLEIFYYPNQTVHFTRGVVTTTPLYSVDTGRSKFVLTAKPAVEEEIRAEPASPASLAPSPALVPPRPTTEWSVLPGLLAKSVMNGFHALFPPAPLEVVVPENPAWLENFWPRVLAALNGPVNRIATALLICLFGYALVEFFLRRRKSLSSYRLTLWHRLLRSLPTPLFPSEPPVSEPSKRFPSLRSDWSMDALQRIDTPNFRKLVAAYYRLQGYHAEVPRTHSTGVDVVVHRPGETTPCLLIQCVAPAEHKIDERRVADFHREISRRRAESGALYTTGEFTEGARVFNFEKNHELVGGADLLALISYLPPLWQTRLWEEATEDKTQFPPVASASETRNARPSSAVRLA